jgi:hypothetical protein
MKLAAADGKVEALTRELDDTAPFGVRVVIHATSRGPRQVAAISESVVDGVIAAFHAGLDHGPAAAAVAARIAKRPPGVTAHDVEELAAASMPGPLFAFPAVMVRSSHVRLSPCDERCEEGEVTIKPDADGPFPQISGEVFALRRVAARRRHILIGAVDDADLRPAL